MFKQANFQIFYEHSLCSSLRWIYVPTLLTARCLVNGATGPLCSCTWSSEKQEWISPQISRTAHFRSLWNTAFTDKIWTNARSAARLVFVKNDTTHLWRGFNELHLWEERALVGMWGMVGKTRLHLQVRTLFMRCGSNVFLTPENFR